MQLVLLHGRHSLDDDMSDWGFSGPAIKGVAWVHWTYGQITNVCFRDRGAYLEALAKTQWPEGLEDNSLAPAFQGDLVKANDDKGAPAFYGDMELQGEGFEK